MKTFLLLAAIVLIASPLFATTVRYVSTEDSIRLSELILKGRVVGVETGYDRDGQIVRNVTLRVEETLKGKFAPGGNFTFQAWGGKIDRLRDRALGEAKYRVGDSILVQLENLDGSYHTLGLSFGKWNVFKDKAGAATLKRDLSELGMVGAPKAPVIEMRLKDFREITRKVEIQR